MTEVCSILLFWAGDICKAEVLVSGATLLVREVLKLQSCHFHRFLDDSEQQLNLIRSEHLCERLSTELRSFGVHYFE